MRQLKIYAPDLSLKTLVAIREDLAKCAHLKPYEKVWRELVAEIVEREGDNEPKTAN